MSENADTPSAQAEPRTGHVDAIVKKLGKRNFKLDALRVFFAILIVIFHYKWQIDGSPTLGLVGVEFFFFVSGYYLVASKYNGSTLSYVWKKLKKLLPPLLAVEFITLAVTLYVYQFTTPELLELFYNSIMEAFGFNVTGLSTFGAATVALWYISALLIGSAILMPLIYYGGDKFTKIVAPIAGVLIMGCVCTYNLFSNYPQCVLRGIGDLCLGIFAYECVQKLRAVDFTRAGIAFLWIVEIALFVSVGYMGCFFPKAEYLNILPMCIVMIFIGVVIVLSEKTALRFENVERADWIAGGLATTSLLLYVSHNFWIASINDIFPGLTHDEIILYLIVLIIACMVAVYFLSKVIVIVARHLYTIFVEQKSDAVR